MTINYRSIPSIKKLDVQRFWSLVQKKKRDQCWPWTGPVNLKRGGYGRFWINRVEYRANRIAYRLFFHDDPGELDVCHRCDNPPCCNPYHLFKGNRAANLTDMRNKQRHAVGEKHGISKLTTEQVKEIRRRYIPRKVSMYKLASEFGVCQMTVNNIVHGKIWRNI